MSSKKYAPAIWLECRANPLLRRAYLAMAALAQLSLFILPWPLPLRLLAMLLLCVPLYLVWRIRCELSGPALTLHWDSDGQWWRLADHSQYLLQLDSENLLTTQWMVLRLREGFDKKGKALAVVLTPEAIGHENYRRLLIRLKQL